MEPPPTVWHCDSDGKGCAVIVAMWQIAEANVRIMQKQRGAATWMHLMGFDNVKISISTKKSEDLHKVFPEINRYIKSGWGFNFCKETATFIMQFAASPVAGENTKFSIRSNWDEFRSKLKVKCLCHSLFSMKFPWSLFTLTNQSRSWDVHTVYCILHFRWQLDFRLSNPLKMLLSLPRCIAGAGLQCYLVLSKDVSCVQRSFAYTILTYSLRGDRMRSVRL